MVGWDKRDRAKRRERLEVLRDAAPADFRACDQVGELVVRELFELCIIEFELTASAFARTSMVSVDVGHVVGECSFRLSRNYAEVVKNPDPDRRNLGAFCRKMALNMCLDFYQMESRVQRVELPGDTPGEGNGSRANDVRASAVDSPEAVALHAAEWDRICRRARAQLAELLADQPVCPAHSGKKEPLCEDWRRVREFLVAFLDGLPGVYEDHEDLWRAFREARQWDLKSSAAPRHDLRLPCFDWWSHAALSNLVYPLDEGFLDRVVTGDGSHVQLPMPLLNPPRRGKSDSASGVPDGGSRMTRTVTGMVEMPREQETLVQVIRLHAGIWRWHVLDRFRLTGDQKWDRPNSYPRDGRVMAYADGELRPLIDRHMVVVAGKLRAEAHRSGV